MMTIDDDNETYYSTLCLTSPRPSTKKQRAASSTLLAKPTKLTKKAKNVKL